MLPLNYAHLPSALVLTNAYGTIRFFEEAFADTYSILECKNPGLMLEILKTTQIDLVLIDELSITAPIAPLCKEIRKIEGYHECPIVIITNKLKRTYLKQLAQAGASSFIQYPLNEEEITHQLTQIRKTTQTKEKTSHLKEKIAPNSSSPKKSFKAKPYSSKESVSLLMLEIDDFEEMTRALKEEEINQLKEMFLGRLKICLRPQDSIKELSPSRYMIILPKTSKAAASLIAENIMDSIGSQTYRIENHNINATISIGIDTDKMNVHNTPSHMNRLIEIAKKRLEQAKQKGNQIVKE